MNILLVAVLAAGIYCAATLRRESFPEFAENRVVQRAKIQETIIAYSGFFANS